jgi:hypothetical protein
MVTRAFLWLLKTARVRFFPRLIRSLTRRISPCAEEVSLFDWTGYNAYVREEGPRRSEAS